MPMDAGVMFHLFGPLQIDDGDQPVALNGVKVRALLAILLLNANSVVSADRLIDGLWGDRPPTTATGTLHAYISRLRRALGAGVLLTQRPGYQLVVDPDQCDALRFERLVERGRAAARAGRRQQAVLALRQALGLWRGPCLEEFADEPFAAAAIARLTLLRVTAQEECIDAELELGHHGEVVEELRQLVDEYPHRERPWCQLMTALYRCGRQAEALDAYRCARARLNEELGVEPGPQLRDMQCRVLRQDPTLNWAPAIPPRRKPGRASFAQLARQYRESAVDDAKRAVAFSVEAGDEAATLLGFAEARTHYEQALELLPLAVPDDAGRRRSRILLGLGRARLAEYDVAGARQAYLEAARIALDERSGDLATAVAGIACGMEFGDIDPDAVRLLETALAQLDTADSALRARLLASLARALPAGEARVLPLAREAAAIACRLADPDTRAFVLGTGLLATWAPDNTVERVRVAGEVIELSEEIGWLDMAIEALSWRSAALQERADIVAAQADLDRMGELTDRARRPFCSATLAMRRGSIALAEGRYRDAERYDERMLADGGEGRNFRSAYAAHVFQRHRDVGRLSDIAEITAAVVESQPDIPAWRPTYALLQWELGADDAAAAELSRLVTDDGVALPRDWLWLGALGHLAEVCAGVADTERAATLLRLLQPYAQCNLVVAQGALSMGAAARHLGLLCTTLGRLDEAEQHFNTAVELNCAWRAEPWLVRTYVAYAEMLRRRGRGEDDERAAGLLAQANGIASRLGMALPRHAQEKRKVGGRA